MGRPTVYAPAIATELCRRLEIEGSLRRVCKAADMPEESTVRTWVRDDREGFAAHYARARQGGYEKMADEVVEIADDGTNDSYEDDEGHEVVDHDHIQRSRLRVDTRKWLLSKVLPKIYGDRVALTNADGGPLQVQVVRYGEEGK